MPYNHAPIVGYMMPAEVAKHLGVSPSTVRRWSDDGTLPVDLVTPGGARRYRLETIERFIALNMGGKNGSGT